ncbi:iron(III) dicitrate transport protein FecA [Nonlabens tegetincola]|uniref:Iron(III) dicitrate transport protein FecA n=2 Tax=Nonlabens tegetincola TaxID=323273 RepID=A0A090Q014_9FLAO|nr:TonB-dependent receptor [Nonlabens tegetincola]GAK96434.1 iron(III) dicitrate transport protein FecA [Nonlabens tegetincola]
MRLKAYSYIIALLLPLAVISQTTVTGIITSVDTGKPVAGVTIYEKTGKTLATTNIKGEYNFTTEQQVLEVVLYAFEYESVETTIDLNQKSTINFTLSPLGSTLTEVEINARKAKIFELQRLKDVEGTSIYAGKKNEVVLVNQSTANLASNNARQIYAQVTGLNIYQNDDAGLQLNIGGRGLDPNRTSNFNTRQNGYDISADVLGYPESYYAPPAEGLEQIQIIRGAASLQYGTQFGGLVNFKMKSAPKNKKIELVTRNTIGNNGLYTNFTSAGGTLNKLSYYTYFNYKEGDGFRPNSGFNSRNLFTKLGYEFNDKTSVTGEVTLLNYIAQQAGGLTDAMFEENPYQSNRSRNWFEVDWLLWNLRIDHKFSNSTRLSASLFGLDASRDALGYRSNRVSSIDPGEERDLIKNDFKNYGIELKFLTEYKLAGKKSILLLGSKYYNADNSSQQGPGSEGSDPNFEFQTDRFPNYPNQNAYSNPNLNLSLFGENIFYINDKWSVTPGFRLEYIKTESDGFFERINTDAAGNVILRERVSEDLTNERSFLLVGIGSSYKLNKNIEFYGNFSQNYRSVTFADINTVNPAFTINPNISDEKGFTGDLGVRGNYKNVFSYDANIFTLFYNDRIGFVQRAQNDGSVKTERGNVGNAIIYGIESLVDFNLNELFIKNNSYVANLFFNTSLIQSEYVSSDVNGIEGNELEFVPSLNFKTGLKFGYKNFTSSIQFTHLSQQFTDASNAQEGNLSGVIGAIPSYQVMDVSASYKLGRFKLETGINNLFDQAYFTRRATGYPGPGIIPSPNRNYYATLEIKF